MANPQDYVTDKARYAERAEDMSGVRGGAPGMAPYPLYGLGHPEAQVALWKRPWFCWAGGVAVGFGAAYAFFGWFKPKYMKRNTKKKDKE